MTKIERAKAIQGIIERICREQRATSVVVRFVPVAENRMAIILKDIRTPKMQARVKNAIEQDLCETLEPKGEYKHRLEYELILA